MNVLLKKELRLILPMWIGAALLPIVFAYLLVPSVPEEYMLAALGCVLVGAASYGREFGSGTLGFLLAQPAERARLWRVKVVALGAALASVLGVTSLCSVRLDAFPSNNPALFIFAAPVVIAGAICAVLLLRQVVPAICLAILVPIFLFGSLLLLLELIGFELIGRQIVLSVALCAYTLIGLRWSWRLFASAEDVSSSSEAIPVAFRTFSLALRNTIHDRERRPISALVRKEFHLHSVAFLIMGGLFLLHFLLLCFRALPHDSHSYSWQQVDGLLAFFGLAWLLIPLFIGCTSVAEERRLGVIEGQFCAPVSRRLQFTIKLLFVLLIGGVLSALLLYTAESIGLLMSVKAGVASAISYSISPEFLRHPNASPELSLGLGRSVTAWDLFGMCLVFSFVGIIGLLISTMVRQTMEALIPAGALLIVAFAGYTEAVQNQEIAFSGYVLWNGTQAIYLSGLMLFATGAWVSWGNFHAMYEPARVWWRAALAIGCAFAFTGTVSAAIYHRVWDIFDSTPAHGAPRISLANPPQLSGGSWSEYSLVFSDGKLWSGTIHSSRNYDAVVPSFAVSPTKLRLLHSHFEEGSHWVKAINTRFSKFVLKDDGTLWSADLRAEAFQNDLIDDALTKHAARGRLIQLGKENDWIDVTAWDSFPLLLKRDGTLWRWGSDPEKPDAAYTRAASRDRNGNFPSGWSYQLWPGIEAFRPWRIGLESNWSHFSINGRLSRYCIENTKGETWSISSEDLSQQISRNTGRRGSWFWWAEFADETNGHQLAEKFWIYRHPLVGGRERNQWITYARGMRAGWTFPYSVGIRGDGTLWGWDFPGVQSNDKLHAIPWEPVQIGTDSDWRVITPSGKQYMLLKSDGTLWKWQPDGRKNNIERLDAHSDWVTIGSDWDGPVALAADGSLWTWQETDSEVYFLGASGIKCVAPWRPQYLGNIFEEIP